MTIDGSLSCWSDVVGRLDWGHAGILLGNGASMAISTMFSYTSLFDVACRQQNLSEAEIQVFDEFRTRNFEEVLYNLKVSSRTCTCFRFPVRNLGQLDESYEVIRNALIFAVRTVHPQPHAVTEAVRQRTADHLANYRDVYTTNYDLMIFWSIAGKRYEEVTSTGKTKIKEFKDFIWNQERIFDPADTEVWSNTIGVHFLHGGLHLYYHRLTGATHKHKTLSEPPLVYFENNQDLLPLFVSEGDSTSKMRSIRRNEYLSFAYSRFVRHRGDLVIFGHSLNSQTDFHIVEAVRRWPELDQRRSGGKKPKKKRVIAIASRSSDGSERVRQEKHRFLGLLDPGKFEVLFFDSATHPLSHQT